MTEQTNTPSGSTAKLRRVGFALACVLVFGSQPEIVLADTNPNVVDIGVDKPRAFLFVGNSYMYYNNSMHQIFLSIAQHADPDNHAFFKT